MHKSKYLEVAIDAAKRSQEFIMGFYAGEITYDTKADLSPVTIADKKAEEIIIQTIKESFPDHSFFGEEFGEQSNDSSYIWVIDPIDGTRNFSRHVPLFATQIALMKDGEFILGVSNAPAINELIYAEKGKGAYFNQSKLKVSDIDSLEKSYFSYGGIKHFISRQIMGQFTNLVAHTMSQRGLGDAWSYHLLAQGKIDIMIEAKGRIWDFAALKVIVEESGGKVTDLSGNQLNLESTSAVATNCLLHSDVIKILNK